MLEGQAIVSELDPQQFRGEFLDCFAMIEDFLSACLARLVDLEITKKAPHLFGQKFALVVKYARSPNLWRNPAHVEEVLLAIQPYAELRGLVCHAIIENAAIGDESGLVLRSPGNGEWRDRRIITLAEARSMLDDLRDLVQKLKRQCLKSPNPVSSPHQP